MQNLFEKYNIIEKELSWAKVKRDFLKYHDVSEQKHHWTFDVIKKAHKEYSKWIHLQLTFEDAKDIILPWHNHRDSPVDLIPRNGLTLYETYLNLKKNEAEFIKSLPDCIEKIKSFQNKPTGIIYLIAGTLQVDVYRFVNYSGGKLVHIDGLHRLLSLFYPLERRDVLIDCYVAYYKRKRWF